MDMANSEEDGEVPSESSPDEEQPKHITDVLPTHPLTQDEYRFYIQKINDTGDHEPLYTRGPDSSLASFLIKNQDGTWVGFHFNSYDQEWLLTFQSVNKNHTKIVHERAIADDMRSLNMERESEDPGKALNDGSQPQENIPDQPESQEEQATTE